ncbi:MAG: hypothetical protein WA071_20785 [Undibacterium umbellatum]|uniref:hypothetical protein n=1 Tax=Undibacterium umbellatum TaxID=2762300 RepID=UPI003BB651C2
MEPMFLDDPALFSVWATPDPNSKLAAAKHLAELYKNYLSLAQCYQEVSKAVKLDRRMQVFCTLGWKTALELASTAPPSGFLAGTSVVAEETGDPHINSFCSKHQSYFWRSCGVCDENYISYGSGDLLFRE